MSKRLWAIVLAGGEGARLAKAAIEMHGSLLPKQFLSFGQERTMLQSTVERLHPSIPYERMVVVVPRCHDDHARAQLRDHDGVEIVAQPRNVGTGPGVLLPLMHVLRRDPQARVALVPSDHAFRRPEVMLSSLLRAERAAEEGSARVEAAGTVLVGASAESPACDLGWIVTTGESPGAGVRAVRRFIEKPPPETAQSLFAAGALWNTMLSVSRVDSLWSLARRHLPRQAELFQDYRAAIGSDGAPERLAELYARMSPADFSRDVMGECRGLRAVDMTGAGWSDCGTPERLARALGHAGPRVAKPPTTSRWGAAAAAAGPA